MPSSPLADLLNSWAAQQDDNRKLSSLAGTIQQYGFGQQPGQSGQPQPVPQQQGGILSNLLGLTSAQLQPQTTGQPAQGGGFFSQLFGIGGGPQPQPAGAPLNLQPNVSQPAPAQPAPSAPQPFNMAPAPAAQPAARPTFPSVIDNTPTGTVGGGGSAPAAPAFAPPPNGALPTFAAGAGQPTGQDNTSKALAFYQAKGLSPLAASALVGGFKAESGQGLNTNALARGDGQDGSNSIGVAQWNGDRAQGLLNYARANGLDPADINTQLQYSWLELNGPEKGTLNALQSAQSPAQATAPPLVTSARRVGRRRTPMGPRPSVRG